MTAFPSRASINALLLSAERIITARDQFAAHAMAALTTSAMQQIQLSDDLSERTKQFDALARLAFDVADAMILERERRRREKYGDRR